MRFQFVADYLMLECDEKLLIVFAASLFTFATHAQGTVLLSNLGGGVNAPIYLLHPFAGPEPIIRGPGPDYSAQLYLVGANNSLTALLPITTFRPAGTTPQTAIADRYLDSKIVEVPGVAPGSAATFLLRTWRTSLGSFEGAKASGVEFGESGPVTINVGGSTLPPANLVGLNSFSFGIWPEPSVLALGSLGAAVFLLLRKKG